MAGMRMMSCCGVQEISGIGYSSAERNLKELCDARWNRYAKKLNEFPELTIFTGVVDYGTEPDDYFAGEDGEDDDYDYFDTEYGEKFADYIRKNGLGEVTVAGEGHNNINHPQHLVRVWLWKPDNKAIQAWYLSKMPKPKPRAKAKPKSRTRAKL